MASANTTLNVTDLDFGDIKNNFISYLKGQNTFKDYNFQGSVMNTLLDVLTYNTQYNAYYLNMVANEMFLDSALQRSSVVSHAKALGYTPKSMIAPEAKINIVFYGVSTNTFSLPKNTQFVSEIVGDSTYPYITTDNYTVTVNTDGSAIFDNVSIKQGVLSSTTYVYESASNKKSSFKLTDMNIDTTTLSVLVYPVPSSTTYEVYNLAQDYSTIDGTSQVYFLNETNDGYYEIVFGDGVLGKSLVNGCAINISYLTTQGTASVGANNFTLSSSFGYTNTTFPISQSTDGGDGESIDLIKYHAPKAYASQGRAVTKEDYITSINQNNLGISFDAVNVWGGEENDPPVYGKVFVCLKPSGSYSLTQTQKQKITNDIIKPISVMTVEPTIVDPDYTYIKISANVLYDAKKTTYTSSQIQQIVSNTIKSFSNSTLNTFNSTFLETELNNAIINSEQSIITSEVNIQLQKKFYPNLTTPTTYNLDFNVPLQKGILISGVNSSPSLVFKNPTTPTEVIEGVYIEEVPSNTGGVESIQVLNPGFNYYNQPKVEILGDGIGATAQVVLNGNGSIKQINVTNKGSGYTSAIVQITSASNDQGQSASAVAVLEGRYGTLRTYYNDTKNVKTILNSNIGTIDYHQGIVTLNSFTPLNVNNDLGQLTINVNPTTTIITSSYNKIITVDPFDPTSILVNVSSK